MKKILLAILISFCALNESCYSALPNDAVQTLNSEEFISEYEEILKYYSEYYTKQQSKKEYTDFVFKNIKDFKMSNAVFNEIRKNSCGRFINIKAIREFFKASASIKHFMNENDFDVLIRSALKCNGMVIGELVDIDENEILLPTITKNEGNFATFELYINEYNECFQFRDTPQAIKAAIASFNKALVEYKRFRTVVINLLNEYTPVIPNEERLSLGKLYSQPIVDALQREWDNTQKEEQHEPESELYSVVKFFRSFANPGKEALEVSDEFQTISDYIMNENLAALNTHGFVLDVDKIKRDIEASRDVDKKASLHELILNYYQYLYERAIFDNFIQNNAIHQQPK